MVTSVLHRPYSEEAVAYLNAALEEFLLVLRNVADAQGGMSLLAKETHLSRETLYRTLSTEGNPRFGSLMSLLEALGMTISINTLVSHPDEYGIRFR